MNASAAIPATLLLGTLCLAACGQTPQVVVLRNGNVLEGQVDHLGGTYRIDTGTSEIRLPERDVERVVATLHDAYAARRDGVREDVLVDRLQLAGWCIRQQLWAEAQAELAVARQLAPNHPDTDFVQRRLEVASRAALRAANQSQPAAVATDTTGEEQRRTELAELEALASQLPPGTLEDFARHVQPILVNGCAAGGCHSTTDQREFRLNRDLVRGTATRESTLRNLQAVWRVIDHQTPEYSPLLLQPAVPHGGVPRPVFDGHRAEVQQKLVAWVRQATGRASAPQPLVEPETNPLTDELRLVGPASDSLSAMDDPYANPPSTTSPVRPARYERSDDGARHFWEDPAALGIESDEPLPPGPSQVRRGAVPNRYEPRDEFDPELFNRQAQQPQPTQSK